MDLGRKDRNFVYLVAGKALRQFFFEILTVMGLLVVLHVLNRCSALWKKLRWHDLRRLGVWLFCFEM
ncbi:MAG: hypothetical protein PUD26_02650 [bacterium]|nr:hypothetical protein [bacterium]